MYEVHIVRKKNSITAKSADFVEYSADQFSQRSEGSIGRPIADNIKKVYNVVSECRNGQLTTSINWLTHSHSLIPPSRFSHNPNFGSTIGELPLKFSKSTERES